MQHLRRHRTHSRLDNVMVFYVAHCYGGKPENLIKARERVRRLQIRDPDNTYLCPLFALAFLEYGELGRDVEMELCYDLLSICDALIVASDESDGVDKEITMAERMNMEVIYLARDKSLRL